MLIPSYDLVTALLDDGERKRPRIIRNGLGQDTQGFKGTI